MSTIEFLKRAAADSGLEDCLAPVFVRRDLTEFDPNTDLTGNLDGGKRGWMRWRSALLAGDREVGLPHERGAPVSGEWLLDSDSSTRLVRWGGGFATHICIIRERAADGATSEADSEVPALREVVTLLAEPSGRKMIRHVFWTLDPHVDGALARRFDRLAGYEEAR